MPFIALWRGRHEAGPFSLGDAASPRPPGENFLELEGLPPRLEVRSAFLAGTGFLSSMASVSLAGCRENRVGYSGNDGRSPGIVLATVARRRGSPSPGWLVHAGGEAGVDFFGIERCDGFGCGKGYRRAVLVTDPRYAVRRRLRTVNDVE